MAKNRKAENVQERKKAQSDKNNSRVSNVHPAVTKKKSPLKETSKKKEISPKRTPRGKSAQPLSVLRLPAGEPDVARLVVGLPSAVSDDPLKNLGELPQSYGTRRVYALARDPEWVFVYWDWTYEQLDELRRSTPEGKVFVRLVRVDGELLQQALVEGGVRDWFFHLKEQDTLVRAEIGVYVNGKFQVAGSSSVSEMPRLKAAPGPIRFATVPFSISFVELARLIEFHRLPGERLLETLSRLQQLGFVFPFEVPPKESFSSSEWAKLAEQWEEEFRKVTRVGSEDVIQTWKIRHAVSREAAEQQSVYQQAPSSQAPSSWGGGSESAMKPREFFMHVNAELIIYGGTDPRAHVRIDGRDIKLAPDGTFYYHFVFPDGAFHIPISATSPDKKETREALLSFLRITEKTGQVKDTPQPGHLTEPFGKVNR